MTPNFQQRFLSKRPFWGSRDGEHVLGPGAAPEKKTTALEGPSGLKADLGGCLQSRVAMQYLEHTYTKKLLVVCLKFTFFLTWCFI